MWEWYTIVHNWSVFQKSIYNNKIIPFVKRFSRNNKLFYELDVSAKWKKNQLCKRPLGKLFNLESNRMIRRTMETPNNGAMGSKYHFQDKNGAGKSSSGVVHPMTGGVVPERAPYRCDLKKDQDHRYHSIVQWTVGSEIWQRLPRTPLSSGAALQEAVLSSQGHFREPMSSPSVHIHYLTAQGATALD